MCLIENDRIADLESQLADAQRIIRQCLAAATVFTASVQELGDITFKTPLKDAAEYVNDRFAEMECSLAQAEQRAEKAEAKNLERGKRLYEWGKEIDCLNGELHIYERKTKEQINQLEAGNAVLLEAIKEAAEVVELDENRTLVLNELHQILEADYPGNRVMEERVADKERLEAAEKVIKRLRRFKANKSVLNEFTVYEIVWEALECYEKRRSRAND